ncbi:MAG: hypothetical protein DRJ03_12890 [Chloroflexi bacterium]|nr:MAG: hypothetical protein DRJ03_12890 [Chloroflexota bacterium]
MAKVNETKKPGFFQKPGFWTCVTLILVALLIAMPLWGDGMVNTRGGGDSPFLLQRAHQMAVNLRAGVFPVRWMPDAAYGLGYPFFSYYAALPYYLVGLLILTGVDILTALKLVQTLGFLLAALAMYGWMQSLTRNRWAAWLAAVAYTVAPFHLVNVYVRGDSLSEFYAFLFYPLILWSLERLSASGQVCKWASLQVAAVALAYAGLLLTHNLSAAIFSPFALLYLIILAWRTKRRWRTLWLGLGSFCLGFLLAAWFWLPAVAELKYVQLGPSTEGYFHYSHHFRALDLVQHSLLFDYSISPDGSTPFAMGLAQAAFATLGGTALIVQGARRKLTARWTFVLLGLLLSTLMITPLSKPLWDHLPLLPVVQFPWRFLSVQALFAAAATTALIPTRPTHRTLNIRHWTLVIVIAALLTASPLLSLHPDRLPITPADVTVERLQLYELFTQNIGTTIRYEWLPQTANPRPFTSDALIEPAAPPRAIPLAGALLEATLLEREPTRQTWQVQGEGGKIAFPLLYWPGWAAQVDGEPVNVWPVAGSGYLALEMGPGEHAVTLRLGRTPVRAAAEAVSLVTALALLFIIVKTSKFGLPVFLSLVVLVLLVLFQKPGFSEKTWFLPDLTMDFINMPYLHHDPEGALSYTLSANELSPGDTLTITLNWPHATTLRLVSPAAVRHPELVPLAEAAVSSSPYPPVSLSLPKDTPRGIYLLQLGDQYLRPVRVPRGPSLPPDAPLLAPFGPDIWLHGATIAQFDPARLSVRLAWSAARPVAANYAVSLRLLDSNDQLRLALDTQPGYGFLPTSLWRPGELVTDRYILALPDDLPPGDSYHLQVLLYQAATLEPVGQARMGDFALPLSTPFEAQATLRIFSLPPLEHPLNVDFGGEVRLAGYDLEQDENALYLTLWWQARQAPEDDYTVFVHLFDPTSDAIVVQSDAGPRNGTYPTFRWAEGEMVSETVTLPLADVPEGTYRLAVGLYDRTVTRLPAIGPDGERLPDDRVILPPDVSVGNE